MTNSITTHTYKCFALETSNGISHVVMNRPRQMNSMIKEFWTELPDLVKNIEESGKTRVIVLSSMGKHFSAGMDLSVFESDDNLKTDTPTDREKLKQLVLWLQSSFNALERCRVPVIAAIQGACIGGAFDMVAACDLRYATADATFKIQEINLAMMADLGGLQRLPYLLPDAVVRQLAFTGEALTADRALALGFVNEILPNHEDLLEKVMQVAEQIAARAPLAISASKEAINYSRDHSIQDALLHCANLQASIFSTADLAECMRARREKRNTLFANLHGLKQTL
ncbi:MAG: enoyl-CoA hydratase/isomerase family protein [Candidatus Melainabacteria bacterium]|nr:enoyl-CoA hydratase/isomerase family protein [Candidatus Melainabacteria bacterium]